MYEDFIKQANTQFEQLLAPQRKLGNLYVDYVAKLANHQLEAARAYSDLGMEQLRSLVKVSDAQGLQAFAEGQAKVAKTLSEKLSQDASTLAGLGKDFGTEVQKLTQESVSSFGKPGKAA